jgi:hypothetical protein
MTIPSLSASLIESDDVGSSITTIRASRLKALAISTS